MTVIKMIPADFKQLVQWPDYQYEWKKHQLKIMDSKDIEPDHKIKTYILKHKDYVYNIEYAGTDIKQFIIDHDIKTNDEVYNFYIIVDFEFSKLPLDKIECALRRLHGGSTAGGYAAIQSFFINYNGNKIYSNFPDSFDEAVPVWIETAIKTKNYKNESLPLDKPLERKTNDGKLVSGSDFMYVHGNIRFWTWK